jgi:two-component system response regulator QseB
MPKVGSRTIAPVHILLIEDDLDLGRALQAALKVDGLSSEWRRRAADAPRVPDAAVFDCVLLDLSLPDGNGFDLLARWRREGSALPVIVITARSAMEDRLAGLDGGADDFVIKPFATAELISRIRAVLRRSARQASEAWALGPLTIEPRRHAASLHGEPLDLSPREFKLLLELAREPGAVVAKGVLAQRLAPLGEPLDFAAVEVHVSNLRRKIGSAMVHTVRGVGYMLAS